MFRMVLIAVAAIVAFAVTGGVAQARGGSAFADMSRCPHGPNVK